VTSLPVIQRPLDNTALSAYMACPREYWYSMYLHRRGAGRSPALAYGSLMHKLLEVYYRTGSPELAEMAGRGWWKEHGVEEEGEYRTLERGVLDFQRYRQKWGASPTAEFAKTVGFPEEPMVEMSANIQGGGLLHPWAVKIDRIIEVGGLHYVQDHKTTSRLDKNYFSGFELSNQMLGYTWAAQQLAPGLRIAGVQINVIHCIKSGTNFEQQFVTFTREQILEWTHNTNAWITRLAREIEAWEERHSNWLEHSGDPADYPFPVGHFGDNGCSRKFGLCGYHDLCSKAPSFRYRALQQLPLNPWNPLEVDE